MTNSKPVGQIVTPTPGQMLRQLADELDLLGQHEGIVCIVGIGTYNSLTTKGRAMGRQNVSRGMTEVGMTHCMSAAVASIEDHFSKVTGGPVMLGGPIVPQVKITGDVADLQMDDLAEEN